MPLNRRETQGIISFDLAKAFDGVQHSAMIQRLIDGNIHPSITATMKQLYEKMTLQVQDKGTTIHINTTVGVAQGANPSPMMFNVVLDPILRAMNQIAPTYALADDTISIISSKR